MIKHTFATVAILTAILLAGCGQNQQEKSFDWPQTFDGEILTIYVFDDFHALPRFAREYEIRNPGVTIKITQLNPNEFDSDRERIGIQLMGGGAPILIHGRYVDYHNPLTTQYFADWLPIIAADPNFNKDDWFMSAFDAMAKNGKLLGFPLYYDLPFGSGFVLANATVPGLAAEFVGRQSISLADMIEIHSSIAPTLAAPMYITAGFDTLFAVENQINDFFDFDEGRVEFSSREFIDFITNAKELTHPQRNFGAPLIIMDNARGTGLRERVAQQSHQYLFRFARTFEIDIFDIFEEEAHFVNPLPLTNNHGELLISPFSTMALNAGATDAQKALALDFLRFAAESPQHPDDDSIHYALFSAVRYGNLNSSNRNYAHRLLEALNSSLPHHWVSHGWRLQDDWFEVARQTIIYHTDNAAELPMHDTRYAPDIIQDAIRQVLHQFHDGLITADQAANYLQNRITLMLLEMS